MTVEDLDSREFDDASVDTPALVGECVCDFWTPQPQAARGCCVHNQKRAEGRSPSPSGRCGRNRDAPHFGYWLPADRGRLRLIETSSTGTSETLFFEMRHPNGRTQVSVRARWARDVFQVYRHASRRGRVQSPTPRVWSHSTGSSPWEQGPSLQFRRGDWIARQHGRLHGSSDPS